MSRGHSNPKYVNTKQWSWKIYKVKLAEVKGGRDKSTIITGDFTGSFNNQ